MSEHQISYRLIRSGRKTLAVEVGAGGVVVRAPYGLSQRQIDRFLQERRTWIEEKLRKREEAQRAQPPVERLTPEELRELAQRARKVIPERVAYYAPKIGVTWGRITIRNQRTRWGSCSAGGNLNFNCLLMLTPPEVVDSVVVHELCHRKEMNHSERFYAEVLRVYPEYRRWNRWLKENGPAIMRRMTG